MKKVCLNSYALFAMMMIFISDAADKKKAFDYLSELAIQYPRSKAVQDLTLSYASGDDFKTRVDDLLRKSLRKGVPSLFASMKKYYSDPDKQAVIENLVLGYRESLEKSGNFDGNGDLKGKKPASAISRPFFFADADDDVYRATYCIIMDSLLLGPTSRLPSSV